MCHMLLSQYFLPSPPSPLLRSLRIWSPAGKCTATLLGHEGPVLALLVTPEGDVLSGSGDTTMRLWQGGRCINTLRGHTDTVR